MSWSHELDRFRPAEMMGHGRGKIPVPLRAGYFSFGNSLIPVACIALLWCVGVIVAYLAPSANHRYVIGYLAVALGLSALLTISAWRERERGRA